MNNIERMKNITVSGWPVMLMVFLAVIVMNLVKFAASGDMASLGEHSAELHLSAVGAVVAAVMWARQSD